MEKADTAKLGLDRIAFPSQLDIVKIWEGAGY